MGTITISDLKLKLADSGSPESKLRRSRNVYELFIQELEKSIKHDLAPKSIALLTGLSAYSNNPQNDMFKGKSSIGKTWNAKNVIKYFPPEDVWLLGGLSPTALVHDYGKLECGEEYTTENLIKNITITKGEPLDEDWIWDRMDEWDEDNPEPDKAKGKHKSKREKYLRQVKKEWKELPKKYVVDLSHRILLFLDTPHLDTFNRLRPILSHDAWEITYKVTDKKSGSGLATKTVTLRGWPATIFCTTDLSIMEDLATRSFTATPSESKSKLVEAIKLIARKKSRPWLFDGENGADFKEYVKNLKIELKGDGVTGGWIPVIPFCDELAEVTPPLFCRDMRDYDHINTLIEMMALLHFYTRPKVIAGEKKYVLATIQDFFLILKIWKDVEMTTQTGLSAEELAVFDSLVKLEKTHAFITLKDIVDAYNKEQTRTISGKTAYKHLENLCTIGLTDKHKDDDRSKEEGGDARRNLYRSLGRLKNRISKAWEYSLPFFGVEDLEKWFDSILKHSPEKRIQVICFSREDELTNHVIRLNPENKEDATAKKHIIQNLFSGEYLAEPIEPEEPPLSTEKPQKHSPAGNIQIQGIADTDLQEKLTWILGELWNGAQPLELAERTGMTIQEVDKLLALLERDKRAFRTLTGEWKTS